MAASSDLLRLAESHVGEDGLAFWDWYFGGGYANGSSTPWCACFVSWCLDQLGVSCAGIPSSYVPAIQTAALGTIKWYKDGSTTATATGATLTIDAGDVTNLASYVAQLEG